MIIIYIGIVHSHNKVHMYYLSVFYLPILVSSAYFPAFNLPYETVDLLLLVVCVGFHPGAL